MVFGRERLESRHEKADIGPPAAGKDMEKKEVLHKRWWL